jgi:hypothetical protein
MIINIFLIIIIFSIFFLINKFYKIEYYTNNNVIFINKDNLINILKQDNDNYYKSFFHNDLYARKITSIEQYYGYIDNSIINFTDEEKIKLLKCIKIANDKLSEIKLTWFDGKKASNILWKLGCIKGKLYENGLPHTRDDIILLSNDYLNNNENKIIKTLIHEKVHIYQKIYHNDVNKYIEENKYTKLKIRTYNDNIRANPDLNNWIYMDKNNKINKALYNPNPIDIEDITYYPGTTQSSEHPYEKMAIDIENYI